MKTGYARFRIHWHCLRWCRGGLIIVFALISVPSLTADPQEACTQPPQPGFRQFPAAGGWIAEAPFAFVTSGSTVSPLPRLTHRLEDRDMPAPIAVRLDYGSRGTLRVRRVCQREEDCPGKDWESYWLEVRRPNGAVAVKQVLYLAYGAFDIAPVDLMDGPGDELLIAQKNGHASPPNGWHLEIWRLGAQPTQVGELYRIEDSLNWPTCAFYRALLTITPTDPKPRAIEVTTDLAAYACCRVDGKALNLASSLRRSHSLQFDAKSGRYVLTGPPGAFR